MRLCTVGQNEPARGVSRSTSLVGSELSASQPASSKNKVGDVRGEVGNSRSRLGSVENEVSNVGGQVGNVGVEWLALNANC